MNRRDADNDLLAGTRRCSKCREWKALDQFCRHPKCYLGFCYCCKQCAKERSARWYAEYYAKHSEREKERSARYQAEHPEKVREWNARHYAKHSEKVKERVARYQAEHPENHRERYARRRAKNPEKLRESASRRRARKAGVDSTLTQAQLKQLWCSSKTHVCYWKQKGMHHPNCRGKLTWATKTIDHVIPISKGGPDIIENVVFACSACNSSKRDKILTLV